MDEAVASENFEDAAKYRDELRKLTEESGAAQHERYGGKRGGFQPGAACPKLL